MRECTPHERRLVDDLERLLLPVALTSGEAVGEGRLGLLEDAHAEAGVFAQQRVHLCAPIDRDENERRLQRHGHERVRGHAVDLLAYLRRDDRHAGGEHPERPPKLRGLELRGDGRLLEDRVADPCRRSRYGEFAWELHLGGL